MFYAEMFTLVNSFELDFPDRNGLKSKSNKTFITDLFPLSETNES